jgi:hypothetical protein
MEGKGEMLLPLKGPCRVHALYNGPDTLCRDSMRSSMHKRSHLVLSSLSTHQRMSEKLLYTQSRTFRHALAHQLATRQWPGLSVHPMIVPAPAIAFDSLAFAFVRCELPSTLSEIAVYRFQGAMYEDRVHSMVSGLTQYDRLALLGREILLSCQHGQGIAPSMRPLSPVHMLAGLRATP